MRRPRPILEPARPSSPTRALWAAVRAAVFAMLFGSRSIHPGEHHPGHGRRGRARIDPQAGRPHRRRAVRRLRRSSTASATCSRGAAAVPEHRCASSSRRGRYGFSWIAMTLLAMLAIVLPAAAVPGDGGRERRRAAPRPRASGCSRSICWRSTSSSCRSRSPAGCCCRPAPIPTTSCCRCRCSAGQPVLALVAFLGGLSAAASMVVVETTALSMMVCNDVVMPALLRWRAEPRRASRT